MKGNRYLDIIGIVILCILGSWRFLFMGNIEGAKLRDCEETIKQNDVQKETQKTEMAEAELYKKVVEHIAGDVEGIQIRDYTEAVKQNDWVYEIQGAYITKERNKAWDAIPDFNQYQFDEDENLINDYSYVSVKLKITKVEKKRKSELCLNSIWLGVFDEKGERVGGGEARTAALNGKPDTASYFFCPLEIGECLETEVVYMIEDKALSDDNFYIININNRGVTPQAADHISIVKLPLGAGVEDSLIIDLKEQGKRKELIHILEETYKNDYAVQVEENEEMFRKWNIAPEMTVGELEGIAQEYLDSYQNGIRIDSEDFQIFVKELFHNDEFPLEKTAEEDAEFGPCYLYMCLYYDKNYSVETGEFQNIPAVPLSDEMNKKTLSEIMKEDFDRNFAETTTGIILQRMKGEQATTRGWD